MLNLSLFTFICAVGAVIVSVLLMLEYKWTRPRKFFKRPPGLPIAGHIMLFEPSCFLTDVKRKIKEYGSFLQLNVFGDTYLVVTDPATIKEALLKRPKTFRRPRLFEAPFNTLGLWPHSLFVAEGSIWNRLRKATAAPFNKQNVGNMGPSIAAEIANSMIRIESKAGEIIDVGEEVMRLTLRIIIRVALGDVSMLDDYFQDNCLQVDTQRVFDFLIARSLFPLSPIFWRLFHSKLEATAVDSYKNLTSVVTKIVEMERNNNHSNNENIDGGGGTKSYIQLLLKECSTDESDISNAEIVSNVSTLLLAGSETTSVSVTWAMYYFSQNPAFLQTAREEVDIYFNRAGKLLSDVDFSEFLLGKLRTKGNVNNRFPFCTACFKEVLRLSGPASFVGLQLVDDTKPVALSNGIIIQPGDTMFCYSDGAQSDETAFPQPETFDPNRWINASPEQLELMNTHFFSFGSGPRICPGMGLAYFEGELILAALICCFDFELACDPKEVKRILSFTAQPNLVPMKFFPRKK